MVRNNTFRRILCTLAVITVTAAPAAASAQSEAIEKITLSPSSRSIKADAGTTVTGSMEVLNSGTTTFNFRVYAAPYGVVDELYDPEFTGKYSKADADKWVTFQTTRYTLKPGQQQVVPYSLNVPANAASGGHYGVVFAETEAQAVGDTGLQRQKRVGHILYVTINGSIQRGGTLEGFSLPFWQTSPPLISTARVANTGNVDFETDVTTTAKDMLGRTKFTYRGDPIVLPDTTRLIEMNWKDAPTFGLFNVSQTVRILGQDHKNSSFVLIAPRWFPLAILLIILAGAGYAISKKYKLRR